MKDKPVILFDSHLAAQPIYTKAWASARGRLFLSEYDARTDSATHYKCQQPGCEHIREDWPGLCNECREKSYAERYTKYPEQEWKDQFLASEVTGEWFSDLDDIEHHIREHHEPPLPDDALITTEDLAQWMTNYRVVLTKAEHYPEIDPKEFYYDELPDDNKEVHDDILAAFGVLNECIRTHNKTRVMTWRTIEVRPIIRLEPAMEELNHLAPAGRAAR